MSIASYDPEGGDALFRRRVSSPQKSEVSFNRYEGQPKTLEQIQQNIRQEIMLRKEKNEANQQLSKFKKALQEKGNGGIIQTSAEKIALLPHNIGDDLNEAVLYAYFAIRYLDDHMFKVILTRTNKFQGDRNLNKIFTKGFNALTMENNYGRHQLNRAAFEIALEKDYQGVAFHFIETGEVYITWDMVKKMITRRQEYLVKQCIKYGTKFDPGSASMKKIVFAGRSAAPQEDRTIKLVDFIQVMLDQKWKTAEIKDVLINYSKKGKIDSTDLREMFLMFAIKRKIKLLSFLLNTDTFQLDFQEDNFIDVIENDAYDIGLLLYREYFLQIKSQDERINSLMVNAFTKSNGMLEAKCFLLKRFMGRMNFEQANKFLEAVEQRVNDSSKGNILILTLNVVKAVCLLIELIEKVKSQFSFLSRRVTEIRIKLVKIGTAFMNDVQSEEEMRFFLLEKDLDERDALNIIYDCEVIEFLKNPFAQNIVQQIWSSQYNNSHSLFTVSSVHRLLFNYNHCQYDEEEQLRFYKKRDLTKYGCHGFQFQVWRYSGEARHLVSSITTLIFAILFHLLMVHHMTEVNALNDKTPNILLLRERIAYYDELVKNEQNTQFEWELMTSMRSVLIQFYLRVFNIQYESLIICGLMHLSWMYLLQHAYDVVFATKNKRVIHLANFGNFIDFFMFLVSLVYVFVYYKDWRYDTFLKQMGDWQMGRTYFLNYVISNFNENAILIAYQTLLWIKVAYCFKLINLTGAIFAILTKLFMEMFTYAIFYFSILFLFSVVGVVLFNDLEEFSALNTVLFTLFKATIQEFDADKMQEARVGAFIGYVYYISFLILNIILIINLIVAKLGYAYKTYNKDRDILKLLATLSVREVSEADDKYSAVVSAPFPLNMLNFTLGSLIISMKSQTANIALLSLYYLPISSLCLTVFIVYQVVIFPFCYLKMIGHKFALMVKSPQGQGARSTLDRAGQAFLFIFLGPILLILSMLIDIFWFLRHLYMMDLDKSHLQVQATTNLNRRTYKKMIQYFEKKNEQLVPQKKVAEDLRDYLDVMEGIRSMVYGRRKQIPNDKIGLYVTYARKFMKQAGGKKSAGFELMDEGLDTKEEIIEQVVKEFEVVKQVLLNNSIPVDMQEIQQNNAKKKGWGMRLLFDKKTFHALLLDLERMRTVLNLKKSLFIFNIPYEGKPSQLTNWHLKVEFRITQTLKFLNTARLLKIIGYDPAYHIKLDNINFAIGSLNAKNVEQLPYVRPKSFKSRDEEYNGMRQENLTANMDFMLYKYQNSTKQMKDLADILKRLNASNQQLSVQQEPFISNENFKKSPKRPSEDYGQNKLEMSFIEQDVNYDSRNEIGKKVNQKQVNFHSPSRYGVLSDREMQDNNKSRAMQIHYSERSDNEAQVTEEDESEGKKVSSEQVGFMKGKKK